ncbi:cytochrome P450 [Crossiella cryophila]|uniref:Cytochrome P450 n=1 Tax=Crossiella cryophila TaxID=43355 RepID=A0A7W7CCB6_9PSEU|nr:cytochrome P450 [Crossiella cryophila]MBB4678537.1 cytochrome P450 [Crossiella cryophila]
MSATTSARPLPVPREDLCPFGPAPEVADLRARTPVTRVTCPTGIEAWLVTRYADVREVLGDPRRFSNRCGSAGHLLANMPPETPIEQGDFFKMDGPEHVRFRRVFAPAITTARRIEEFRPMVLRTADELLDGLAAETGPVDLHERFSKPLTSSVIAGLLGVPYADRGVFQRVAETLFSGGTDVDELNAVKFPLYDYVADLVRARRAEPGEDVLSVLVTRGREHEQPFNDLELTKMAVGLLVAGYDTTASSITYGVLALLADRTQFDRLAADPALAVGATEELVRLLGVGAGLLRVATVDTEIGGQPIAAGEYVIAAAQAANHDPAHFPEPERLDIDRRTTSHLGFGHGPHHCVGQQIARLELTTALATLPCRVPTLRLAVPQAEIRFKADTTVYGPAALPVTWDEVLPS